MKYFLILTAFVSLALAMPTKDASGFGHHRCCGVRVHRVRHHRCCGEAPVCPPPCCAVDMPTPPPDPTPTPPPGGGRPKPPEKPGEQQAPPTSGPGTVTTDGVQVQEAPAPATLR